MANERTIYQNRPNMILGCKKAIYGVIVLILLFWISAPVKSLISDLQIYMISYIKIGLTGYVMLAIVLLMLFDLIYIIWQLLSWYSTSYTLTNQRIIAKRGVLNTKKTYMPYRSIQDIDLSQNIFEKILNIGTIRAYSAYDNNSMVIANISNPGEVEEILFNQINQPHQEEMYAERDIKPRGNDRRPRQGYDDSRERRYEDGYYPEDYRPQLNDRFVEDESPHHYRPELNDRFMEEEPPYHYREYEYEEYPEYGKRKGPQDYDYEYYNDNLEDDMSYAMNDTDGKYNLRKDYPEEHDPYYNESEPYYNDYDYDSMEEFYQNNKEEMNIHHEEKPQKESSENIVERHFKKFNR